MMKQRKRSYAVKPEGLALIEKKMRERGYTSRQQLADVTNLTIETLNNVFHPQWGRHPQRNTIEAIASVLNIDPAEVCEDWYPPAQATEAANTSAIADDIDWREVCRVMLKEQQQKQRLRRQATEMGFEVNVHVPLGLVERKEQPRRVGNIEREQVYGLNEDAIAKIYQHDDFLHEIIKLRQSSNNQHIAIIGEPGAGKTTLLGAIASFIESQTEYFPICIPLASLEDRTLQDYLLKTWLPEALGLVNPQLLEKEQNTHSSIEQNLIKRFRQSGVWLLLDGVDEMGADSPIQALATIQTQITDWVAQARVVLTCRLNVWDASVNNTLTGFDTYRTQEFTHEQVDEFIQQWFACAEDAERGEQLQTKLTETGRERIRELVKHPLRLALLCQTFYLDKQGELPETKAVLYQRFTRYFYEWKQNLNPVDSKTTEELHQALGKLALAGINSVTRFRLKENLARQEMGEKLFKLACDVGWLNLIDRDAATDEPIYAFFHPNFQEYFAALAIDDWHYFLNHYSGNPAQGTYRIFEPQWKEAILLWLGRNDVGKKVKEQFISALVNFEDNSSGFYQWRSIFLAVAGIAEFKTCSRADKIVNALVSTSFGSFNPETEKWKIRDYPLVLAARAALLETDRSRAINAMINLLNSEGAWYCHQKIADILSQISPSNSEAINALSKLCHSSPPRALFQYYELNDYSTLDFILGSAESLQKFDPDNKDNNDIIERYATKTTKEIKVSNYVFFLFNSSQFPQLFKKTYLDDDEAIAHEVIPKLVELLRESYDAQIRLEAAIGLWYMDKGNENVIATLVELLSDSYEEQVRVNAAKHLWDMDEGNNNVINTLIQLLKNSQNEQIRWDVAKTLLRPSLFENHVPDVIRKNPEVINQVVEPLVKLLQTAQDDEICLTVGKGLGQIAHDNPKVINQLVESLVELINTSQNEQTRVQAAETLCEVTGGNEDAIMALIEMIHPSQDDGIFDKATGVLKKIRLSNLLPLIVTGLKDLKNYLACYEVLWHCAQNMTYQDFYQAWHCQPYTLHTEESDTIPASNFPGIQALKSQYSDMDALLQQLQPTNKTYPICVNLRTLEGETDTGSIAQGLCNKIYRSAFPDEKEIPPEVSNPYQLERALFQIKKQLQKQHLALIIDKCEPNHALVKFCHKLTDVVHIAWITNQPIEPPIRGFPPEQPNLFSVLQSWLDEIG